jgi:hypothetical protein
MIASRDFAGRLSQQGGDHIAGGILCRLGPERLQNHFLWHFLMNPDPSSRRSLKSAT